MRPGPSRAGGRGAWEPALPLPAGAAALLTRTRAQTCPPSGLSCGHLSEEGGAGARDRKCVDTRLILPPAPLWMTALDGRGEPLDFTRFLGKSLLISKQNLAQIAPKDRANPNTPRHGTGPAATLPGRAGPAGPKPGTLSPSLPLGRGPEAPGQFASSSPGVCSPFSAGKPQPPRDSSRDEVAAPALLVGGACTASTWLLPIP